MRNCVTSGYQEGAARECVKSMAGYRRHGIAGVTLQLSRDRTDFEEHAGGQPMPLVGHQLILVVVPQDHAPLPRNPLLIIEIGAEALESNIQWVQRNCLIRDSAAPHSSTNPIMFFSTVLNGNAAGLGGN